MNSTAWGTQEELEFIDNLGKSGHTAKLGRLPALMGYANALKHRTDWINVNAAQVQLYLTNAIRLAEQQGRIQSFHNP